MDAATQMFFTLSLGFGALISFASYMPIRNNCVRDAYTVVFINCGTSIFAGIVVFSILGHREFKLGESVEKVRIIIIYSEQRTKPIKNLSLLAIKMRFPLTLLLRASKMPQYCFIVAIRKYLWCGIMTFDIFFVVAATEMVFFGKIKRCGIINKQIQGGHKWGPTTIPQQKKFGISWQKNAKTLL